LSEVEDMTGFLISSEIQFNELIHGSISKLLTKERKQSQWQEDSCLDLFKILRPGRSAAARTTGPAC